VQLYRKIDDFCNQIILDNRSCNITGRRFLQQVLQMVTPPACTKLKEEDLQLSVIIFDTASIT
jgi:hypothetical protein